LQQVVDLGPDSPATREAASNSRLDDVIVSTDNPEIAEATLTHGVRASFPAPRSYPGTPDDCCTPTRSNLESKRGNTVGRAGPPPAHVIIADRCRDR
jgi:hypothetical protein